jgi:hypothetical protein
MRTLYFSGSAHRGAVRSRGRSAGFLLLLTCAVAVEASAQIRSLPVLQNVFFAPGLTVAGNYGTGSDAGSTAGGALAWSPAAAKLQLSGGLASHSPEVGKRGWSYGIRGAMPLMSLMEGSLGLAAFAGVGVFNNSAMNETSVPIGAAVGYRMSFGSRGISLYGAPYYARTRTTLTDSASTDANRFRGSAGLDVTITPTIGATVGYDGGKGGGLFGIGLSWAMSRPSR